ncbi:uncharacterized protein LOC113858514 isoform X2 [Abrus precatorius]|uniref:Uncharacterized protein LOC113858514 isoform X2 n=1 Tax=Abrus precatorius TaxID=3816 RepID=A0A8B8KSZ3_ABRPR|nr:uncharacterized protein LOC113858514 isoform X2 [Abrus precatorius]
MDEGKLNIDAPLMSVRRSSGASPSLTEAKRKTLERPQALPHFKPNVTLDQVTEPVAVPFNWEHIPGRPKDDGGSQSQPPREPSITPSPSFPLGKLINVAKEPLEKESNIANKFRNPSISNSSSKVDCDREKKYEKTKNVEEDDDYDNDVYSDALDILSPTEPLSMNCSVSGLDNLDANKCGTSSTDKQTQDFMMSRFLPAAKAMTIQPPQYASRKQPVVVEQPREFTKLVREEKQSFVNRHITDIIPYTAHCQEEEEEEEESEDETNDYANISAKGCGLLPRLCVRNSLCLLNSVPGTKMGHQFTFYSAHEAGKTDKGSQNRSYRPAPAIKKAWDAIHKSKSSSGDMHEVRKKWTSDSNRYTYSGELKHIGRLSPFRRSRAAAAGISPFRSKTQPLFPEAMLLGDSKRVENINHSGKLKLPSRGHASTQEVLTQGAKKISNSGSLAIEKTLYIDTASTVKLSCSNSSFLANTQRIDSVVGKERNSTVDSFQDMKHLQALEENLDSQELNSMDANPSTLSSMFHLMAKEDEDERLNKDQEINQESMSLQLVQSSFDKDTAFNNKQIVVADDSRKVSAEYVLHHLAPPLPKSPSESWLCRALPLVSSKNSFPYSNQGLWDFGSPPIGFWHDNVGNYPCIV